MPKGIRRWRSQQSESVRHRHPFMFARCHSFSCSHNLSHHNHHRDAHADRTAPPHGRYIQSILKSLAYEYSGSRPPCWYGNQNENNKVPQRFRNKHQGRQRLLGSSRRPPREPAANCPRLPPRRIIAIPSTISAEITPFLDHHQARYFQPQSISKLAGYTTFWRERGREEEG